MNLRVILFMWIVAIAVILSSQYNSYLLTRKGYQLSLTNRNLLIAIVAGFLVFHTRIFPSINEQISSHNRKL
jgi:hypothetical protein